MQQLALLADARLRKALRGIACFTVLLEGDRVTADSPFALNYFEMGTCAG